MEPPADPDLCDQEQWTGGEQVAEALGALGVRHVFTVASIHNLAILRAIRARGTTAVVDMRHEQGAVHAADAYARSSGELGVAVVSTGPGTANAMGGLYEAAFASSRVLLITGQADSRYLDKGRGDIHEAPNQSDMLRQVCREVLRPRRGGDVGDALLRLAREVLTGRPRPAALEVPVDLQTARSARGPVRPLPVPRDAVDSALVAQAAELLRASRRPLIWAGGGVVSAGAGRELVQLAERLAAPVVTSREGRGAIPEDHELAFGSFATVPPLRAFVEAADCVLAVGTRFQMYPTDAWSLRLSANLIHLDVDPSVIDRSYRARIALVGDARLGLAQLAGHLPAPPERAAYICEAREAARLARERISGEMGPDHEMICAAIRRHLPRGGAVVRDATVPAYVWGDRVLPILEPRTSIRPVSAGIGPGLPFAIGAATATGEPAVLIQGDGGLMLSIGELASAVQERAHVIVCVFNDRGYGVLREIIGRSGTGPPHDVDLATPDFTRLAESFGAASARVRVAGEFEAAFAAAVAREGPTVLEIDMSGLQPLRR
jgi:acetolactate synthase-1/2/3 large subunit